MTLEPQLWPVFKSETAVTGIIFRYQGKQHAFTLDGNPTEELAAAKVGEVDLKLHQLKQRFISVPPEMDICEFLKYEGSAAIVPQMAPAKHRLASFRDQYVATHKVLP